MDCDGAWWESMGVHPSLGIDPSPGIHGGLWQVWKVPNSNVNSKNSYFFDFLILSRSFAWKNWFYSSKTQFLNIRHLQNSGFLIFKTSISRNHAYRILHSRFPPFGFVLKPFRSIYMFLNMIRADSCEKSFSKHRFPETMPIGFSIVDFPPSGLY